MIGIVDIVNQFLYNNHYRLLLYVQVNVNELSTNEDYLMKILLIKIIVSEFSGENSLIRVNSISSINKTTHAKIVEKLNS